jgi:hypothetical protein
MQRLLLALAFTCACCAFSTADDLGGSSRETKLEVQGYYSFPNQAAVDASGFAPIAYGLRTGASTSERDVGSSWGGAGIKAILSRTLAFPAFVGPGALTSGNNVSVGLSGELTPLSVDANVETTLTPIAFLNFALGAGCGTGWDIGFPGLGTIDSTSGEVVKRNFGGLVYRAWAKGTFQFDLAAVLPGDWNHIVVQASPYVEYRAYTGADANTAWTWEADDGMDFNGWTLYGEYFIGYKMPIAISMVGLLLQTQRYIGSVASLSTMASDGWGSDFTYCTFGPLFNFALDKKSSLAILPQFKTGIDWTDGTTRRNYFENRVYESPYLYFYRVAFDYSLEL